MYVGQNDRGRDAGQIDAASASEAAELLAARGLIPISIEAVGRSTGKTARSGSATTGTTPASSSSSGSARIKFFDPKIGREEVMLFSRQMHVLIKSGVPILTALGSLRESASVPAMREVLDDILRSLEAGVDLSTSMARHPKVFDKFYLSMVRVGEETGSLESIFQSMFLHLEFDGQIKQQVKVALRYPGFVVLAILIALVVVNIFVVPAFATVFKGFNAELPIFTRILVATSDLMLNYWWAMVIGVMGASFGFKAWIKTQAGRRSWHRMLLRAPIAGPIVLKSSLARFTRSFGLSLRAGVPVLHAIRIVADTADNEELGERLMGMQDSIEHGDSVLRAARTSGVFPPMVLQMIAVGDESGAMDDMMDEVSSMYTTEVQYEIKTLAQRIEPILVLFMAGMVLILALGIFLPIWDLGRVAFKH